jgi:Cft2 family RNA processing exonuclease
MLGSVQYKIQTPEISILYTGDINCVDTLTTKAANPSSCDVLILEATFGHPFYVFPERERIYSEIVSWVLKQYKKKRLPVFQAYSAGKAQEVVKLLNTFTQIPVVTHPTVSKVNRVYINNGTSLDFIDASSEEGKDLIDKHQCIYVLPNSRLQKRIPKKAWAVVTGWALKFKTKVNNIDCSFPLSSHADFNQLKNYVEKVAPKKVYTIHGYKEAFAKYVQNRLGIRAEPLTHLNQRRLVEYL